MDFSIHNCMIINNNYRDINPLVLGWQTCSPGYSYGPANRTYLLLHYVISGTGIFKNKNGIYKVNKGQIFVINPFEITFYKADNTNPWTYYWIGFDYNIMLPDILKNSVIDAQHCEHIFLSFKNIENIDYGKEMLICSKIYELLSMLSQNNNSNNKTLEYVLKAKNYIESNYTEDIKIKKLAQYLNIERCYFSNIFKKHIGISPQQYLIEYRLNKAAQLISLYGYNSLEAAISSGYKDSANFSRMFKKYFGVSPSIYSKKS